MRDARPTCGGRDRGPGTRSSFRCSSGRLFGVWLAGSALAALLAGAAPGAAQTLPANPGPANNGGSPNWAIFFDVTATSGDLAITEMTTASTAAAGAAFTVEVFTRVGTALGGPVASGPGSSATGWTSLGTAPATQGGTANGVSLPIDIPDIALVQGQLTGVAVRFTVVGPRYFGTGTPPYSNYSDANLALVTGDVRSVPFTTTGSFFTSRALVGSLTYVPVAGGCELTCPANVTVSNDAGSCGANVSYPAPTTTGTCGAISCAPVSGAFFAVGTTPVLCEEQIPFAPEGGVANCTFNVTVNDTQPPTITAPANPSVGTDPGLCSAVVNYPPPTVSDNCPGVGTPSCVAPSGSTFTLGDTAVACTVQDAAANSAGAGFTVTVFDDEPPALVCPADIFEEAPAGSTSWPVDYVAPTPTDNCPGATAVCSPPSGDPFPIGTTSVNCSASDGAGLNATCGFDVTIGSTSILEIPTASTLGLAALALLLGGAAFVALRRRA